jgi:putative transposase
MARRQIYDGEGHAQFVTFSCFHRRRLLDHPLLRDVVVEALARELAKRYGSCSGFVVMPDHVHVIVSFRQSNQLSNFMKCWKQATSLLLKKRLRGLLPKYAAAISPQDPFWQAKYYPFNLFS